MWILCRFTKIKKFCETANDIGIAYAQYTRSQKLTFSNDGSVIQERELQLGIGQYISSQRHWEWKLDECCK